MGFELNQQQKEAFKIMLKWFKGVASKQVLEVSGMPGTGKTTIINYFKQETGLSDAEVVMCSYTGKAVQQLIRKGNKAKTIHSLFYRMVTKTRLDENGLPITKHGRPVTYMEFEPVEEIDSRIKLIIIDEGAMVGKRYARDILSYGIPVVVLGDINQLPPVMDGQYFFKHPDIHLTQLMRQAEGDPIVELALKIINNKPIEYGSYGNVIIMPYEHVTDRILLESDILLAGKNSTRDHYNNRIRYDIKKRKNGFPVCGDKIICRQNNWKISIDSEDEELYLINGLSGFVTNVHKHTYKKDTIKIDFQPDFTSNQFFDTALDHPYFMADYEEREFMKKMKRPGNKFELADCITVHLSQGSEWDFVTYFKEDIGFNRRYNAQLSYTAVTRAKQKLAMFM